MKEKIHEGLTQKLLFFSKIFCKQKSEYTKKDAFLIKYGSRLAKGRQSVSSRTLSKEAKVYIAFK